ncbi:hypothetical protein BS78_05G092600 [Paspalum vaginatum]|nr:hypothetical protein BS78_05G092600 [Paspalum vaginatum]
MSSSGHRRSRRPSDYGSSSGSSASRRSTRPSTSDTDVSSGDRRSKRSSGSFSCRGGSPDSPYPSWMMLNKVGACQDGFHGDRTTSATSRATSGKQISVSLELVEPPGTSVLILDYPQAQGHGTPAFTARWRRTYPYPHVVAAHRDVVLLEIMCPASSCPLDRDDYFVYQASGAGSSRRRRPSLSLLPARYYDEEEGIKRPYGHVQILMNRENTGIMSMSCTSRQEDEGSSFMVAHLEIWPRSQPSEITLHMFRSGCGEWETFKNLHVRGAHGGRDLRWWSTDAVVPYRRWFLIWVDYYRGMILLDTSSQSEEDPPPPELRYVPLPVDTVSTDPEDMELGRGRPEDSHCVCATRDGIKFVSVDRRHYRNFGVGHARMLRKTAAAASPLGRRLIPHLTPEFPVVNMENPDAVCFRLNKDDYKSEEPEWMIEVHMRKKTLLAAAAYSKKKCLNGIDVDEGTIRSARTDSYGHPLFPSELPRYLDGGQACKKRRR